MGKTSLMLNWASGAWRTGARVAFFSLEMDTDELMDRIAAAKTGISSRKFGSGTLDENERRRYNAAIDELAKWRGYFDDASAETLPGLDAKCRRLMNANGLDLVFVDYLQLVSSGQRANNRVEEVSQITVGLKRLARSLRIPIVVGAQLSREVKNRSNKRPELTDLRESGSIEQDSDIVIMLHRDSYYNADAPPGGETELLIRKYRNGPTGIVKLIFEAETTRFVEVAERLRTWWDGM
jgi:replicative DNA helicase